MNISHLYLSGGGVKGFAYIGIIKYMYLYDILHRVKHIAGTSIGAYFGLLMALQIPSDYIQSELYLFVDNIENHLNITTHNLPCLFDKNGILSLEFLIKPVVRFLESRFFITLFIQIANFSQYCS